VTAREWRELSTSGLLLLGEGALIRIATRTKAGDRVETARLNWSEARAESVYFGYGPSGLPDSARCAWGCATLRREPRPFGVQRVEVAS
jgi:hypothetical protein